MTWTDCATKIKKNPVAWLRLYINDDAIYPWISEYTMQYISEYASSIEIWENKNEFKTLKLFFFNCFIVNQTDNHSNGLVVEKTRRAETKWMLLDRYYHPSDIFRSFISFPPFQDFGDSRRSGATVAPSFGPAGWCRPRPRESKARTPRQSMPSSELATQCGRDGPFDDRRRAVRPVLSPECSCPESPVGCSGDSCASPWLQYGRCGKGNWILWGFCKSSRPKPWPADVS